MFAVLLPVVSAVVKAVAAKYVSDDDAISLINFGFDVVEAGVNVNTRLQNYTNYVETNIAEARSRGETWQPTQEDFDNLWAKIHSRDDVWDTIPD